MASSVYANILIERNATVVNVIVSNSYPSVVFTASLISPASSQAEIEQQDPCQAKSKVVADATYCDRYWECLTGERELYDCPNGLVWVGKNRGIADGCDYPWRNPTICRGKDLASEYNNTKTTALQVALKLSAWYYLSHLVYAALFTIAKYTYRITT